MKTGGADTMQEWMRDISRRVARLEQEPRGSSTALLGAVQPEVPTDGSEDHAEPLLGQP